MKTGHSLNLLTTGCFYVGLKFTPPTHRLWPYRKQHGYNFWLQTPAHGILFVLGRHPTSDQQRPYIQHTMGENKILKNSPA